MKQSFCIFIAFILILSSCKTPPEGDFNLKHVNHVAYSINNDLSSIRTSLSNTVNTLQHNLHFDKNAQGFSKDLYEYSPSGTLISKYIEGKSAIYYPSGRVELQQLKKIIINSEILDSIFVKLINENILLSQTYFLDTNSFLRIYPYVNVENYIEPNLNLKEFAPYQFAHNKPFITEKAYWLNKPIADPYGRGWIFSCVEPIYYRDHFIGILSGDITLRSLKTKYLSSDTEMLMLIDQKSKVICCTKEAGKLVNVPFLREFGYYKPITEDVVVANNPTLTEHSNKSLSKAIKAILAGNSNESFYIGNTKYTIYKSLIQETDWYLLKIIN